MMDEYEALTIFKLENMLFSVSNYEEYVAGQLISKEDINLTIKLLQAGDVILVHLEESGSKLANKISNLFEFDLCISLNDRLQLTIFPQTTNVSDLTFQMLASIISHTRDNKVFSPLEPIVGHIFTKQGHIVKISFKMTNPERLIEFNV